MAKRPNLKKKDDVIESIESSSKGNKNTNLGKKKDPKQSLTDSIEQRVKEAVVKIEAHRRNARVDNVIAQGIGGGDDLDFFTDDISNGYEYSKKDSKEAKKLPVTDFVLRPVSDLDTYKSKDK
jgi:glucose-6-phosphate isomerase